MTVGRCGDLTVQGRNADALPFPFGLQLPPDMGCARIETEDSSRHAFTESFEPAHEEGFARAAGQPLHSAPNLSDRDGADIEAGLVVAQPFDDRGLRFPFHGLRQHIRVNEVAHREMGAVSSFSRGGMTKGNGHARR